ncbi:MAG: TIGR03905 family TSCPD domain-containing protein [Treponema sp.]|jgi:uncharacterized protein (TIGR03905 family)|nr:TIGR03905 family TSCPD domain-containing protein [Treponema sp.]
MYEYITNGTCSTKVRFKIEDGKLYSVSFENGCDGNLKAIGKLLEGMDAAEAVKRLKGVRCGNKKTSCGDQLAAAVEKYL